MPREHQFVLLVHPVTGVWLLLGELWFDSALSLVFFGSRVARVGLGTWTFSRSWRRWTRIMTAASTTRSSATWCAGLSPRRLKAQRRKLVVEAASERGEAPATGTLPRAMDPPKQHSLSGVPKNSNRSPQIPWISASLVASIEFFWTPKQAFSSCIAASESMYWYLVCFPTWLGRVLDCSIAVEILGAEFNTYRSRLVGPCWWTSELK